MPATDLPADVGVLGGRLTVLSVVDDDDAPTSDGLTIDSELPNCSFVCVRGGPRSLESTGGIELTSQASTDLASPQARSQRRTLEKFCTAPPVPKSVHEVLN